MRFRDRVDAGRQLATRLARYADRDDVVVLALPRGGVPIGYEIATRLRAPLDVFLVRKLGMPGYPELAMGAIASGGVRVLNVDVIRAYGIPMWAVERVASEEAQELERRARAYRGNREPPDVGGRTVILVDDGLATGSTMRAAVSALRKLAPAAIVVAVPIAAPETCAEFRSEVDDVVCFDTPQPFSAVGRWYDDFSQTTDEEVMQLLEGAASARANAVTHGRH
jgi:putative phosphoribosyl transferase